ncbi:uncharacterized protein G2W53_014157 [Senna tora]|uniref:Uncharacterized protein n=1 Tax=Senna tora TaxID=362788 RepID=A0A835C3P5_9FABA|nr:uncharacterized protein G2W53_014157 [Senna tora]
MTQGGDVDPFHEGTSSKDHEFRVADFEATPSWERDISSLAPFMFNPAELDWKYEEEHQRFTIAIRGGGRVPVQYARDSEGSLHVMSTNEVGLLMYTFVMDQLSVKPPLTPFEMTVLGVLPTMKLFSFFYQLGQNSAGQPWHFAKVIHPFWLEKQNRPLFSFVWSKASQFPSVEEKDIFPQEAGIVKRISQGIEANGCLKIWRCR